MKTEDYPVAKLTIHGAGAMDKRQRGKVAAWLVSQAEALLDEGEKYSDGLYTARYFGRGDTGTTHQKKAVAR